MSETPRPPQGSVDTLERPGDMHDPTVMGGEAADPHAPTVEAPISPEAQLAGEASWLGKLVMKTAVFERSKARIATEVKQKTTEHVAEGQAKAARGDLAGARDSQQEIHRTAEDEVKLPRAARLAGRLGMRSVVTSLAGARTEASQEQRKTVEAAGENWQSKFYQSAGEARKEGKWSNHDTTLAYVSGQMEKNKESGWEKPLMEVAVEARSRGDKETYDKVVAHLQQRLETHKDAGDMSHQKVTGALKVLGNRVAHVDAEHAKIAALEKAQQFRADALDPRRVLEIREAIDEKVQNAAERAKSNHTDFDVRAAREDALREFTREHFGVTEKELGNVPKDIQNKVSHMLRGSITDLKVAAAEKTPRDAQGRVFIEMDEKGRPRIVDAHGKPLGQPEEEAQEEEGPSFKPKLIPGRKGEFQLYDEHGLRRQRERQEHREKVKAGGIEYTTVAKNAKRENRWTDRGPNHAFRLPKMNHYTLGKRKRQLSRTMKRQDAEIERRGRAHAELTNQVRGLDLSPALTETLSQWDGQPETLQNLIHYHNHSGDKAVAEELRNKSEALEALAKQGSNRTGIRGAAANLHKEYEQAQTAVNNPESNVVSLDQARTQRTANESGNENGQDRVEPEGGNNGAAIELVLHIGVNELSRAQGNAIDSLASTYKYVLTAPEGTEYTTRDGKKGVITQDVKDGVIHTLFSATRAHGNPDVVARATAILRESLPAGELARLQGNNPTESGQRRSQQRRQGGPRDRGGNGTRQGGRPGQRNGKPGTGRPRVRPAA